MQKKKILKKQLNNKYKYEHTMNTNMWGTWIVIIPVIGNEHGEPSSNPRQGYMHLT